MVARRVLVGLFVVSCVLPVTGCSEEARVAGGTPDPAFGGGDGLVFTTIDATLNDVFYAVTTDSSNRLIVVGATREATANADIVAVRYQPDGSLDTTWGSAGIAIIDIAGFGDAGLAVAIDSSGRTLITGYAGNGSDDDWVMLRLTASGVLDTTFNTTGYRVHDTGGSDVGRAVVVMPNGDIAFAGATRPTTDKDFTVLMLDDAGAFQTTFDGDGMASFDVLGANANDNACAMVRVGTDLIVAGTTISGGFGDFAMLRIDSTGAPVTSFGSNGVVSFSFPDGLSDEGLAVAVTGSYVYMTGRVGKSGGRDVAGVTRHALSDGALDNLWGSGGYALIDFGGDDFNQQGEGIIVQSDGKVVIAGTVTFDDGIVSPHDDIVVGRLTAAGALDTAFSDDGKLTVAPNGLREDRCHGICAHKTDGFVIVGETEGTGPVQADGFLLRYLK
ncbi:MAG: delta-60 repeat domain-containing protein [Planctomycetota bacterium]